ncbi:hypothetical protein CRE_21168 [Caenorhabditis remanei]|uniref:Ubiquitin-like domain-containing protein n=1 Tax=Caenorhabditis remanei TaxID=31234 RepID=E3MF34_CAERE|nr:hypothetical protein CRE_21168 [Caenorhabditis remanei]
MLIKVQPLSGKILEINVYPEDKVYTIKEKVEQARGISAEQLNLIFRNQKMVGNKTISEFKVSDGVTVYMTIKLGGPGYRIVKATGMHINVNLLDGRNFEIKVKPSDTVLHVKRKIHEARGFHIYQQILLFRRQGMADEQTVSDVGITEGGVVHMLLNMPGYGHSTRFVSAA